MDRGIAWALAALVIVSGCAQGESGDGPPPTGRGDAGPTTGRDSGPTARRDGGGGDLCMDEGHGRGCELATDLGTLAPGDMAMPALGYLPVTGDEDWFSVALPDMGPGMPGGGTPTIELARNDGDAFRFEVRGSCSATLGCGDGTSSARDLTGWSFVDDQAMEGEEAWSTRDVPWPADLRIRVYRLSGPGDCNAYQLVVSR